MANVLLWIDPRELRHAGNLLSHLLHGHHQVVACWGQDSLHMLLAGTNPPDVIVVWDAFGYTMAPKLTDCLKRTPNLRVIAIGTFEPPKALEEWKPPFIKLALTHPLLGDKLVTQMADMGIQ